MNVVQGGRMVLFLDFDGVLHPKGCEPSKYFSCLAALESFLMKPKSALVRIVISSTWRDAYSLDELRNRFEVRIRPRVIGMTPALEDESEYPRYDEIRAWLKSQPNQANWIALDDDPAGFPDHIHGRVIFTNPLEGLKGQDLVRLEQQLSG
jgi:hypothetical protein